MKMYLLGALVAILAAFSAMADYEYEAKGNQGWLVFDSDMTIGFDLGRSGKDKDHVNFIDNGGGVADYGWYNLDTGASGSFSNGATATFSANDRIGLYVTDNKGNTYLSTKPCSPFEEETWGKARIENGNLYMGGGNMGSNGTHEFYVFKVNSAVAAEKAPSGQPLPGIIATLVIGGGAVVYLKKRKKLYAEK